MAAPIPMCECKINHNAIKKKKKKKKKTPEQMFQT